jgi:hypothetical protein
MTTPLRSISITDAENACLSIDTLIGVDESGNESTAGDGFCVVVAVRAARTAELDLVRALVQSGLQPFQYKSATLGYDARLTDAERRDRVQQLLTTLKSHPVTWSAIVCRSEYRTAVRAAAAVMAVKKTITSAAAHERDTDRAALLHDGKLLTPNYKTAVRQKAAKEFDTGFQHAFFPVCLVFVNQADLTYPQSITADYIAGYLRSRLLNGTPSDHFDDSVLEFDESWTHSLETGAPLYYLDAFSPIRGEGARSRAAAWIRGTAIPLDPDPTDIDIYEQIIGQIDDSIVYRYLSDEL